MNKDFDSYLECEKRWVFRVLIFVAGFYGAYTLSVRGGVFCNAQTANMALFAVNFAAGDFQKAAYYLIPMSGYFLGTMVSEAVPKPLRRVHLMRWDTVLTLIEIMVVIVVGFIPATAPDQICQIIINFVCAMQYNTFRQAEGVSMATTFCTDHMRQFSSALTRSFRHNDHRQQAARKAGSHGLMLLCFLGGGLSAGVLCRFVGVRAIWFAVLPLAVLFADLLHADLTTEKELLDVKPHGH